MTLLGDMWLITGGFLFGILLITFGMLYADHISKKIVDRLIERDEERE